MNINVLKVNGRGDLPREVGFRRNSAFPRSRANDQRGLLEELKVGE